MSATYFHARYQDAQRVFLDQIAYMARTIDQWAEERGGADALSETDRRSYEGRKRRLFELANFNDCAQALIDDMAEWIGELIQEKRQLTARINDLQPNAKRRMFYDPAEKEAYRHHTIETAMNSQPNLY